MSAPCRRTCRDRLRRCFSCYAIGGPSVTGPPPASAAAVSLALDDLWAVEEHRRISALTPEELQSELDEIERKRSLVAEARQELATRRKVANGAAGQ